MSTSVDDAFRPRLAAMDFLAAIVSGLETTFNAALNALSWVGAFHAAIEKLVASERFIPRLGRCLANAGMKAECYERTVNGVKAPPPDS